MTKYQVAVYVIVDADDAVQAAQKAYAMHVDDAPDDFEVLRVDGYHEEEDAEIGRVTLDEQQKVEARKWQQQTDLFLDMVDKRGAVDKMKQ
jgi:hypothetical protein